MGKIGRFEYPDIGPFAAKEIIEVIKQEIGDTVEQEDREQLAQYLGHQDAESGAFRQKLTALRRYALVTGRGTLLTTELADKLVDEDPSVYKDMLHRVLILEAAYETFSGEPVDDSEWEGFLEDFLEVDQEIEEISGTSKLKDIYIEFVRLIPEEEKEEVLDVDREFQYYISKLQNENTRDIALEAIRRNLKEKKLPDADPVDTVLTTIRSEQYPDQMDSFYRFLYLICDNNDLAELDGGKRDEVVRLLEQKLKEYSQPGRVSDRRDGLRYILETLEVLHPDDIVDDLWWLVTDRLQKGVEQDDVLISFVRNDLAPKLMRGNDGLAQEFYETKADEAEDDLWGLIERADNEELIDQCEYLLGMMGVIYQ